MLSKSRNIFLAFVFSVVALSACQPQGGNQNEQIEKVVVQASWLPNAEFSFVCSAIVEGYYEEEGLDVELRAGGPAISFARSSTILAQEEEVYISIESVLTEFIEGRAKPNLDEQLRVKAIGAFWQDNPLGFLVREDGASSLEDLFTKTRPSGTPWTIGATPDAVLIEAITDYYGISYDDLDMVTTSYDATPFLLGEVDALWSFWTTQAYEAELAGIPYRFLSLSEIPGLAQPAMIVLTREDILQEKQDVLVRWFRASLQGATFTLNNPEAAARYILDERCGGPDFDYTQELWMIEKSLPLFEYNNSLDCMGYIDPATVMSWTETYLDIAGNPNIPSIETLIDFSILEEIYGPDLQSKCR
jgi:ABC-type nitrate/sulfonate/bicarbonate transport system substrate-binding protein